MLKHALNLFAAAWRGQRDSSSLAVLRIGVGAILVWEVFRFHNLGRIEAYNRLAYHFPWAGLEWVKPFPEPFLQWFFVALAASAALMSIGLFYRSAAIATTAGFVYIFALDQSYYLNHFYLVCLLLALLASMPAADEWSADVALGRRRRRPTIPAWPIALIRTQLFIVFTFAAIAKLNTDWLCGYPLRTWVASRSEHALFASLTDNAWLLWTFVYGGILGDLLFIPAILWRRTRLIGLAAWTGFHLCNAAFFQIGIFPWLMLAATVALLPQSLPRATLARLRGRSAIAHDPEVDASTPVTPALVRVLIVVWIVVQVALPLRHVALPGWVDWTEEGHNFAWRMKLRSKSGTAMFDVYDPTSGRHWKVSPDTYLSPVQARKLAGRPELVRLWAHWLAERWGQAGFEDVTVRADVLTSLNGRRRTPLVDPTVDLAAQPWTLGAASWILPLDEPLPACAWAVRPGTPNQSRLLVVLQPVLRASLRNPD